MAETIYEFLKGLGQDGILTGVAFILVLFFVLGLLSGKFRQAAPALMTSLGIFGTFCGIFLALWPIEFEDRSRLDANIQELLNGMKTAFVTSLLGIGSAVAFRAVSIPLSVSLWELFRGFAGIKPPPPPPEQQEVLDRLDAIKQAIAGEGDSSMATQMQKLRLVNSEGFKQIEGLSDTIRDALMKNLENLTNEIRDIIGKQLGDSLKDLINSIQEALIERFGETFVEFSKATLAIKEWQEDHRGQVEQLTTAFNLAADRIATIAAECEKIPPTMERLREVTETARHDVDSLNRQVEAFAAMRRQAEESFPVIKAHLDKIGEDLSASASGFEGLNAAIKAVFQNVEQESRQAAERHARSMSEMSASMREALGEVESETRQIAKRHSENVQQMVASMVEAMTNAQNESAQKVTDVVDGAVRKFSEQINREIDRVTEEWGRNLVAVAKAAQQAIEKVEDRRDDAGTHS